MVRYVVSPAVYLHHYSGLDVKWFLDLMKHCKVRMPDLIIYLYAPLPVIEARLKERRQRFWTERDLKGLSETYEWVLETFFANKYVKVENSGLLSATVERALEAVKAKGVS